MSRWSAVGANYFFFDDENELASERARAFGGSVYRRPDGRRWTDVPQIRGEFACIRGDLARYARGGDDFGVADCSCEVCRRLH